MRIVIRKFAALISIKNGYTKDQEEQIEYALRITIFETLKGLGTIFLFSLFGYFIEAIVVVITMAIIKPFIGGYHEDTQVRCFIAVLIIVGCVIFLSINVRIDVISKLILSAISLFCIWNQAPVVNPKMNLTKAVLLKRNRNIGLFLTALFIIISVAVHRYNTVSDSILWIIVVQAMLMFNKRNHVYNKQKVI